MGQYWKPVNLDKREFISPHKLGAGLKLWEQLANAPGTGAALVILCAAMPYPRGGGDFHWDGHGPPGLADYYKVAQRTIGRWAGDRIALVGDYAEDSDLPGAPIPASQIYGRCFSPDEREPDDPEPWTDITDDVCAVIEHELKGKFVGEGWRDFVKGAPTRG